MHPQLSSPITIKKWNFSFHLNFDNGTIQLRKGNHLHQWEYKNCELRRKEFSSQKFSRDNSTDVSSSFLFVSRELLMKVKKHNKKILNKILSLSLWEVWETSQEHLSMIFYKAINDKYLHLAKLNAHIQHLINFSLSFYESSR